MKIIRGTFGVHWKQSKGGRLSFMADVTAPTATHAAQAFLSLFPGDLVVAVRGFGWAVQEIQPLGGTHGTLC